ncbi:MAG: sigma-54 interaction domain-containing protein, partial [Terriglobales bacterium]
TEDRALRQENRVLKRELRRGLEHLLGESARLKGVKELVATVAPTSSTILITGESGTGKELVARAIHACSPRADRPFVSVNCGAFPETLLESELFGYMKGAFTGAAGNKKGLFESADSGTIFLDEIAEMTMTMQVKLLRVLQERKVRPLGSNEEVKVDVRVIAATNKDLQQRVREGAFREDVYYRISVIPIELPPLRDRREDIPLLAMNFLRKFARAMNRPIHKIDEEAMKALERYDWPGNVRELENAIERAVVLCKGHLIDVDDLPPKLVSAAQSTLDPDDLENRSLREAMEEPEKRILETALRANGWNRQLTAEKLGINRTTLYKKMKRYGLEAEPPCAGIR